MRRGRPRPASSSASSEAASRSSAAPGRPQTARLKLLSARPSSSASPDVRARSTACVGVPHALLQVVAECELDAEGAQQAGAEPVALHLGLRELVAVLHQVLEDGDHVVVDEPVRTPVPHRHAAPDRRGLGDAVPVAELAGDGDRLGRDRVRLGALAAAQQVVAERGEQGVPGARGVRLAGIEQLQGPPGVLGGLAVGQPGARDDGGLARVLPRRSDALDRHRLDEVVRQPLDQRLVGGVARPLPEGRADPRVQLGPPQRGEVPDQHLLHERVGEPPAPRAVALDDQAHRQCRVQRGQRLLGGCSRGLQQVERDVAPRDRRELQDVAGARGQAGQPGAQHLAHRGRHRHAVEVQVVRAHHPPGELDDEERVAARAVVHLGGQGVVARASRAAW